MLPRILHFYQGPLWLCCIWMFETHWLYSKGKCIHYVMCESESTENVLSSPLREIDFIMVAEWAFSCRNINLGRITPCSLLSLNSLNIGKTEKAPRQDPKDEGIRTFSHHLFLLGASQWFIPGASLSSEASAGSFCPSAGDGVCLQMQVVCAAKNPGCPVKQPEFGCSLVMHWFYELWKFLGPQVPGSFLTFWLRKGLPDGARCPWFSIVRA